MTTDRAERERAMDILRAAGDSLEYHKECALLADCVPVERAELERLERAVLCLMRELRCHPGVYGQFEESSPGPTSRALLADMGMLATNTHAGLGTDYDWTPAAHEFAARMRAKGEKK